MALKVADRVKENTSSTGTGGISFTGSPTGFQTFGSVLSSGDITYYAIEENDKWEVGIGTYGSSNLERNYILGSSNSGNKVDLGGSGTVFLTYPAEKSVYRNQENQAIVGASGLVFDNGTIIKDAKITELYDVNVSGTPTSTHLLSFDVTNKGLLVGDRTGPSNDGNVLLGYGAGSGVTSANQSVIIGSEAAIKNQTGSQNVHIGYQSGPVAAGSSAVVYNAVSVGYQAGHKMRHYSTAIGHQAGIDAYEIGFVAMGYQAASGIGSYSVAVGMEAGNSYGDDYATIIGYQAGYNGGGVDSIWVGRGAGHSSAGAARSIGIGKEAGKSSTANDSIYIGKSAGQSNTDNDLVFIGNASPAAMGTLFKGDMDSKRVAVGNADITLADTFHVGINTATDKGVVVKSAAAQSADLTQWVNASDSILASVSSSGIVSANGLVASGAGLQVTDNTPVVTANTLYSVGGGLYWNGSPLAGGGGTVTPAQLEYVSGIAVYASGEVGSGDVTTDQLNYVSGIAVYSSGQAIANESDISTNVTNITATTSVANYASGVVTGGTPTFGNMYVDQYIYHNGDNDTYIRLRGDQFDFVAGGRTMLTLDEAGSDIVTVNDGANDVDFQVKGDSDTNLIRTDAANDLVGIGTSSPAYKLDVVGHDAWVQSSGIIVGNSGIVLASNTPSVTTNTLYNDGGALKFNGSAIGEGDVTTDQLNYVSGIAVYSSGQALSLTYASGLTATNASSISTNTSNISNNTTNISTNAADIVTTSGALRTSINTNAGNISTNTSNISTNATNITSATNTANYASGQAIDNEGDIVAVSGIAAYASGHAHDDLYVSGVAAYASGNTSNIAFGSNAEGDILYHNGTSFTRLPKGTNNYVLTMDGNLPVWEAGGGGDVTTAQLVYVSGLAVYGSGQAESLNYASGVAAYASGNSLTNASNITTNTTNITANASDIVAVSGIAHYASGHVHDDLYVSGVANYASGVVTGGTPTFGNMYVGEYIYHNGDVNTFIKLDDDEINVEVGGENMIFVVEGGGGDQANKVTINNALADVDFQVKGDNEANLFRTDALNDRVGIGTSAPSYRLDVVGHDAWVRSSGVSVGNSGVILARNTPSTITDTLYNVAGTLYFNGSQLASAGGASAIAQYASGEALSLTYASGLTATNASNISTNTTNITAATNTANYASGEALSLTYASGLTATNATNITAATNTANYASGEALSLTYASGLTATNAANIAIVSGVAYNIFSITAGDGSDYTIDGMGLNSASDPTMYLHKGHSYTFNKTFSGHPFRVSATDGGSAYQDADGNNIEIGSDAGEVRFEVPQNAPDKLYYYCTAHPSSMKGVIYTTTNVDEIVHVSGIAAYASGQAIANEADIATNVSNISTNTTNITAATNTANYASGQALSLTYASGLTATNASNISTNTTNITAATNTANYASGQALSLTYASGLTATNASSISTNTTNITAATNTANYASGEAVSLIYASGLTATNATNITAATNTANYASGEAVSLTYASGLTATNAANISTNTTNITAATNTANYASGEAVSLNYASGVAAYASGQALSLTYASGLTATNASNISTNTTNITAATNTANYASGEALSLNSASGVAAYASGNTANIDFGSNAQGDMLYHNGTTFTRLAKGTDNYVLTMDGNVPAWEAAAAGGTTNASGAIYQVQYNADGDNFGADPAFIFAKDNSAFDNPYVLAVSGTIVANTGDANYSNPVSIGSGAYVKGDDAISIGWKAYGYGIAIGRDAEATGHATGGSVAIGHYATATGGDHRATAVGYSADSTGERSTSIGTNSSAGTQSVALGDTSTGGSYATAVGYSSWTYAGGIAIGISTRAGGLGSPTSESASIAIGYGAKAEYEKGISIGKDTVSHAYGIALGQFTQAGEGHFILGSGSALASVLLSGVFGSHLTLPNGQQFRQIASAAQTSDLTQWQNSAGVNVAAMTPSGVLNTYGVVASGAGVRLEQATPTVTTDTLYNVGGTLYFDGSTVGGGGITWDGSTANGVATYKDADEATVESNLTFDGNTLTVATSSSSAEPTVIKGAASQTADLTSWQNSAGVSVAAMTSSGILNVNNIRMSGVESIVLGPATTVGSTTSAIQIGHNTTTGTPGHGDIAIGNAAVATGGDQKAIAIGNSADATNKRDVAIGSDASATGSESVALGDSSSAATQGGIAIGYNVTSTESFAVAIGRRVTADGHGAIALGAGEDQAVDNTNATGERALAIGAGAKATQGTYVIASGNTAAAVAISGVYGSYMGCDW